MVAALKIKLEKVIVSVIKDVSNVIVHFFVLEKFCGFSGSSGASQDTRLVSLGFSSSLSVGNGDEEASVSFLIARSVFGTP